jgi:DNA-binding MarR family transcriptional regulator
MARSKTASRGSINFEAMANFRYAIRSFLSFSENAARAAGLEAQQYQALLALKGMPANQKATVGVLAERLLIRHHSAVELAIRLETNRLVRRIRSSGDRREVHIELAPRGEKMLRHLALTHRAELVSAAPTLIRALKGISGQTSNGNRKKVLRGPAATPRSRAVKRK